MIVELAERIRREPTIDAYGVYDICNSYLGREIDASPYLFTGLQWVDYFKYIGRETSEQGLRFIGSATMVITMFGRYFFRGAERRSL